MAEFRLLLHLFLLGTPETLEIDEQEDDAGTGRHTRFAEIRPVTFEYAVDPDVELVYEGEQQANHGQQRGDSTSRRGRNRNGQSW